MKNTGNGVITVQRYIAVDGTEFKDKCEAVEYQRNYRLVQAVERLLDDACLMPEEIPQWIVTNFKLIKGVMEHETSDS